MNKVKQTHAVALPNNGLIGNIALKTENLKDLLKLGVNWAKADVYMLRTGKIKMIDNLHQLLLWHKNSTCTLTLHIHTSWQQSIAAAYTFAIATSKKFRAIYYSGSKITEQFIANTHKAGLFLLVSTNSPKTAQQCTSLGAFVCSDNPQTLRKQLK